MRLLKKKIIAYIVLLATLGNLTAGMFPLKAEAATKKLTITQAQQLALANSPDVTKYKNKIALENVKYASAVKSIKEKKKNLSTFRWSPLLSFKFPQSPTMGDEYDWQYKPFQIQNQITIYNHQLKDVVYSSREKTATLFIKAYVYQEKIDFLETNLEEAKDNLSKNKLRLAKGDATQADIDKLQARIDKYTSDIALQMSAFEDVKLQLKDLLNLDVTSGYHFENPMIEAQIPRSALDTLTKYTLENDQTYHEAKMAKLLAKASLDLNESLMRDNYGGKLSYINIYIQQAKAGEKVDTGAFKSSYEEMLKKIDAPWDPSIKIIFWTFSLEWFKGATSGSRYMEDDPYALFTSALEYSDKIREEEAAKKELTQQVKSNFEAVNNAGIAFREGQKAVQSLKEDVDKAIYMNLKGQLELSELKDVQSQYEEQVLATLDLQAQYSQLLYSYDRLTCGGVTAYLQGSDLDMQAAQGGNSYLAKELNGKAYYYIDYAAEDNIFTLGVSIPEDFSVEITDYALYVNGMQIGEKTPADKTIRHLGLDFKNVESSKIYFYNGEELIDICEFDASVNQDELDINGGYTLEKKQTVHKVATYHFEQNADSGKTILTIEKEETEPIVYYRVVDKMGNPLYTQDQIPIDEAFVYLSLLEGDLGEVNVEFYDVNNEILYIGNFETSNSSIVVTEAVE